MKTAQFIRRFSFDEWGGTENVVWNSVKQLHTLGDKAQILATSALDKLGTEINENIEIKRFKYFYPYFPLSKKNIKALDKKGGAPYSLDLMRTFSSGNYDLIHVHSGGRCAQLALYAAKKNKIPCILSLHGGYADIPKNEMSKMLSPLRGSFHYGAIIDRLLGLNKDLISEMSAVICVGENEYNLLSKLYPKNKIVYIPNGVDTTRFDNIKASQINAFRKKYSLNSKQKILLCVSRIDYQKNQKLLVEFLPEALKFEPNLHLLLIGPETAENYSKMLRELIKEKNIEKYITIINGLAHNSSELSAAFNIAECFVLPSLHEPFGIVILEAWSARLPVLSTEIGGAGMLVDHGKTALRFNPNRVDSLLNCYKYMKENTDLRIKIAMNGKNESLKYSWENVASKLHKLYRSCIKNDA